MNLILVLIVLIVPMVLIVSVVEVVHISIVGISNENGPKNNKQDGNDQEYHTTTFIVTRSLLYGPCLDELSLLTKMIMVFIDILNVGRGSVHNQYNKNTQSQDDLKISAHHKELYNLCYKVKRISRCHLLALYGLVLR